MTDTDIRRRRLLQGLGAGLLLPGVGGAPALIAAPGARPQVTDGVQSGDLQGDRAVIWSRCDRAARMIVEWDTRSVFSAPRRLVEEVADASRDFTARIDLSGLPPDQSIFYRVRFEDARDGSLSEPWFGHLRSSPLQPGTGGLPGLRGVLGVRRRPAQRRRLRPRSAGWHLRSPGGVP